MEPRTAATVRALLTSKIESDFPDHVLAALKTKNAKPLTKKILEIMPEDPSKSGWYLNRNYGMTHLETYSYARNAGKFGYSFLMAYTESSGLIDVQFVEERNPSYFSGRRERNTARAELLSSDRKLEEIAVLMNRAAEVVMAVFVLDQSLSNGPDSYAIRTACGLYDAKGQPLINHSYQRAT